jgi:hypothetical protein
LIIKGYIDLNCGEATAVENLARVNFENLRHFFAPNC